MNAQLLPPSADEMILQWLLRVARRADASVRVPPVDRMQDRRTWLRAEQEIFAQIERGAEGAFVAGR